MSKSYSKKTKNSLKSYLEEKGISQAAAARAMALSSAVINQYLSGKYTGNIENVERKIKSFLRTQREKENVKEEVLIENSITKKIHQLLDYAKVQDEIIVITGPAGVGKTTACKMYKEDNPSCINLEVDLGYCAKVTMEEIADRLHLSTSGKIHYIKKDIIDALKGTNRLIIIDQAEYLTPKSLEMIRSIHDKANIGVALLGLKKLHANLRGKKGQFAQLYSRVGAYDHMSRIEDEDIYEYVIKNMNIENENILDAFVRNSRGSARNLSKLCKNSRRLAKINNEKISTEIVNAAGQKLIRK